VTVAAQRDALLSEREQLQRQLDSASAAVGGALPPPQAEEPETPGMLGRLFGRGREEDVSAAIREAGGAEGPAGGASPVASPKASQPRQSFVVMADAGNSKAQGQLQARVDELGEQLVRSEKLLSEELKGLNEQLSRSLAAKSEANLMLEEQRAGALEQLASMQIDCDKLNAQLSSVLKVRDSAGDISDLEALQVECDEQEARIEALETQVTDVVSANKELFAQTAEAMEENTALSSKIEEVMGDLNAQEEALNDAHESIKELQSCYQEVKDALQKVMSKALKESQTLAEGGDVDAELAGKCATLSECIQILQASKAVSDTEARTGSMWRTRCVELQAQRDAALEIAASLAAAQGVEDAMSRIRDYFE